MNDFCGLNGCVGLPSNRLTSVIPGVATLPGAIKTIFVSSTVVMPSVICPWTGAVMGNGWVLEISTISDVSLSATAREAL